tara:strand:- start:56 stop:466 length:411 start_codon:yes stop_codon:yes gene_type:complete
MEPDFLATIKLITGEEIIAKVSYMPEDDSLVLENPMEVNGISASGKGVKVNGFALTEWIKSTFEQMFILPKKHVVTMTEVEDKRLHMFYDECVSQHITQITSFKDTFEPRKFTREMGSLGSAKDTRTKLEDLYKRS